MIRVDINEPLKKQKKKTYDFRQGFKNILTIYTKALKTLVLKEMCNT